MSVQVLVDTELRPGARILAEPAGSEVARVNDARAAEVRRIGTDDVGYALVEYRGDDFVIRGYVAVGDVSPIETFSTPFGDGGFGRGSRAGAEWIKLPRGTCLYWEGVKEPIGIVTRSTTEEAVRGPKGEWYLRAFTGWGPLDFLLHPLDAESSPKAWQRCPWSEPVPGGS